MFLVIQVTTFGIILYYTLEISYRCKILYRYIHLLNYIPIRNYSFFNYINICCAFSFIFKYYEQNLNINAIQISSTYKLFNRRQSSGLYIPR